MHMAAHDRLSASKLVVSRKTRSEPDSMTVLVAGSRAEEASSEAIESSAIGTNAS